MKHSGRLRKSLCRAILLGKRLKCKEKWNEEPATSEEANAREFLVDWAWRGELSRGQPGPQYCYNHKLHVVPNIKQLPKSCTSSVGWPDLWSSPEIFRVICESLEVPKKSPGTLLPCIIHLFLALIDICISDTKNDGGFGTSVVDTKVNQELLCFFFFFFWLS